MTDIDIVLCEIQKQLSAALPECTVKLDHIIVGVGHETVAGVRVYIPSPDCKLIRAACHIVPCVGDGGELCFRFIPTMAYSYAITPLTFQLCDPLFMQRLVRKVVDSIGSVVDYD